MPDRYRFGHFEPHIAINANVGQVVDLATEGRNLRVLRTIDLDGDQVITRQQIIGQPNLEGRVAILVRTGFFAIDPDHGISHRAIENQ